VFQGHHSHTTLPAHSIVTYYIQVLIRPSNDDIKETSAAQSLTMGHIPSASNLDTSLSTLTALQNATQVEPTSYPQQAAEVALNILAAAQVHQKCLTILP
jgi:hypothetical protein